MRHISIYARASSTSAVNARIDDAINYIHDEFDIDIPHSHVRRIRNQHHNGSTFEQIQLNEALIVTGIDVPDKQDTNNERKATDATKVQGLNDLITVRTNTIPDRKIAGWLAGRGVTIHNIDAGITIKPRDDEIHPAAARAIETLNEEDTDPSEAVTGRKHPGGRPPIGLKSEGGMLRAADDYSTVRMTLHRVEEGEMTRAEAARRLDCVPRTIDNALQKRDLYRLDAIGT